jgi:hypothetical protein
MRELFIQAIDVNDNCLCYCSFKTKNTESYSDYIRVVQKKYKQCIINIYDTPLPLIRIKPKPNFAQLNKKSYE